MTKMNNSEVSLDRLIPEHITDEYISWLNNPTVMQYTEARFSTHTFDDVLTYVKGSNGPKDRLWRILFESRHVGNIRLSDVRSAHGIAEMALIVGDENSWGKGVASTAIDLAAQKGFEEFDLRKITAIVYGDNVGSSRAFEKGGFKEEARLTAHFKSHDTFVDAVYMTRYRAGETSL